MPKPNVTRVQSATQWIASVHTLHMPKPNVTRVQSAMEWTASVCENIQVFLRSYIGISQTPKQQTTKHDRHTQSKSTSKSLISVSIQVSEAPFTTHQTEKCQLSLACSLHMFTPLLLEQKVKSVDQKLFLQRSNEFKSNQTFKSITSHIKFTC